MANLKKKKMRNLYFLDKNSYNNVICDGIKVYAFTNFILSLSPHVPCHLSLCIHLYTKQ